MMHTTRTSTRRWQAAFLLTFAAGALLLPDHVWAASRVRLEARLTGNTRASGQARYEQRGRRLKLSIEVEDAARGVQVQMVARRRSQTMILANTRTNNFGFVDFNRDTLRGQFVPILQPGDVIEVRTASGVLVRGTLQAR